MKIYKVLEAHQGDKAYLPNDPNTGTRIADPNEVLHLVKLGLLEELGDAPDEATAGDSNADAVDLLADVAALTRDLELARTVIIERDAQIERLHAERDTGSATLQEALAQGDELRSQIGVLTTERDEARAEITRLSAHHAEPDYERDDLGKLDIRKASTTRDQLLVIAAYEKAEVAEDEPSKADLIKAIEAKRKAA
ncbi:hypothetical protein [Sphingomonas sp. ID0503]|uniref:hypothetical protein n=1 Tax=Sphingomonas sp. ID0503 TaxID=3399691 RepID=UPI003AFB2E75